VFQVLEWIQEPVFQGLECLVLESIREQVFLEQVFLVLV